MSFWDTTRVHGQVWLESRWAACSHGPGCGWGHGPRGPVWQWGACALGRGVPPCGHRAISSSVSSVPSPQGSGPTAATSVASSSHSSTLSSATTGFTRGRSRSCATHVGGRSPTSPRCGGTPRWARLALGALLPAAQPGWQECPNFCPGGLCLGGGPVLAESILTRTMVKTGVWWVEKAVGPDDTWLWTGGLQTLGRDTWVTAVVRLLHRSMTRQLRGSPSWSSWTALPRTVTATRRSSLMTSTHHPNSPINCCLLQKMAIFTTWPPSRAACLPCMRTVPQTRPASLMVLWGPRTHCWPLPSVSLASWHHRQSRAHIPLSDPRGLERGHLPGGFQPALAREGWMWALSGAKKNCRQRSGQGWLLVSWTATCMLLSSHFSSFPLEILTCMTSVTLRQQTRQLALPHWPLVAAPWCPATLMLARPRLLLSFITEQSSNPAPGLCTSSLP